MKNIKVIAFDADDTLWVNEPYFRETEDKFCTLLEEYLPNKTISKELFRIEIQNLKLYGFGIKGFMLSMIESAIAISNKKIPIAVIEKIIALGKEMLEKDIELLDGIENTLKALKNNYRLVVATKGDLLDQERKLIKSGLQANFHHIEVMSDKKESDYLKLIKHLDINPSEFLMIGNSLKSDIIPVLEIGGYAIHIPYHTTWEHEKVEAQIENNNFHHFNNVSEVVPFLLGN